MPITENTDRNGLTTVYRGQGALLPQKDLIRYLREERGHSLNAAKAIAKECRTNETTSARELPSGWSYILHPPKILFERRGEGLVGTQIVHTEYRYWLEDENKENGLSAIRQDSHTEAVTNTH